VWFKKDAAFDDRIRQRFLPDYERAAAGDYTPWRSQPRSCLALILLLDQVPRNLFRGDARSYATDAEALAVAEAAIAQGHDQALIPVERLFMYLPLEHSEDLARQQRCVQLFETLVKEAPELASTLDYAYRHRDVIARFGRFPHRNHILGRTTTPEEAAFLQQPGSRF
jgi:uncharacterized protein (DUF924 family)